MVTTDSKIPHKRREIVIDLDNDVADLVFFIIMFFVVVLFMLPNFIQSLPLPYSCSQHNNDFTGCVRAQNAGKGCAWYAQCSKCAKATTDIKQVCK